MKYCVEFAGFAYVEANSMEEAIQKAEDDNVVYSEVEWISAEKVNEFVVRIND